MWNEALIFSVPNQTLAESTIELVVINDNLLGSSEPFGKIVLGSETSGEELTVWKDMISSKHTTARWHYLTPP